MTEAIPAILPSIPAERATRGDDLIWARDRILEALDIIKINIEDTPLRTYTYEGPANAFSTPGQTYTIGGPQTFEPLSHTLLNPTDPIKDWRFEDKDSADEADCWITADDSGDYCYMAMDSLRFLDQWLCEGRRLNEDFTPHWTLGRIRDLADAIDSWEIETGHYFGEIRDIEPFASIPEPIRDHIDYHGSA